MSVEAAILLGSALMTSWLCAHLLWLRERRWLCVALPGVALAFALSCELRRCMRLHWESRCDRKSFGCESVALLEGLQASFEAGLTFEAAMKRQEGRRRWRSGCGRALEAFRGARAAGLSLVRASDAAGEALGTVRDAGFLRAALTCLASGAESGMALSSMAAAFAERLRSAQKMRERASALSAQVRFQARVLLLAPFALAFIMWMLRPGYVGFFVSGVGGFLLLGLMTVLHVTALFLLRRLQRSVEGVLR